MANIVGEEFKPYVAEQINLRQEIHGKLNRTTKELSYLNSRTSWIKLASGVDVDQSRLDLVPEIAANSNYLGIGLATDFVLFNGTSGINTKTVSNTQGIGAEQTTTQEEEFSGYQSPKAGILGGSPNPAYGILGDTKYGLVPMPGIESVTVKSMDKGTIKRASVKIKAYNRIQFDIIDILYLRLGYTLLLEWGDSHYLDNKNTSNPVTSFNHSITENAWFNTGKTTNHFKMLKTIETERKKYSASYDALFGKIVNFKWTFTPDGTYDINLDIISLGDVIESLKMNVAPYLKDKEKPQPKPTKKERRKSSTIGGKKQGATSLLQGTKTIDEVQEENSPAPPGYDPVPKKNIIEQMFYSLREVSDPFFEGYNSNEWADAFGLTDVEDEYKYKQLFQGIEKVNSNKDTKGDQGEIITIDGIPKDSQVNSNRSVGEFMGRTLPYDSFISKTVIPYFYDKTLKKGQDSIPHNKILNKDTIKQLVVDTPADLNLNEPVDYIQMNFYPSVHQYYIRFGAFLKLLQDIIFPHYNQGSDDPILKIDFRVDDNFMYYVPNMISTDPKICIIQNDLFAQINKTLRTVDRVLNVYPQLEPFKKYLDEKNSYGYLMNIYVNFNHITKLFEDVDKEGNVYLMEMMRNLCGDLNSSLGGVNQLEPKIDPSTNTLTIYDRATLPGRKKLLKSLSTVEPETSYNLELFGYNLNKKPNQSNFVHTAGITTEVTNDYAIMTTIGATANGQVVGEDSTAFSKWNKGIKDRFKLDVSTGRTKEGENISGSYNQIFDNYYDLINEKAPDNELAFLGLNRTYLPNKEVSYSTFTRNMTYLGFWEYYAETDEVTDDGEAVEGGKIDPFDPQRPIQIDYDLISSNTNVISSFYKELHKRAFTNQASKKIKASNQGGFMPFNLNLELDGISGMKIYSKLKVQQTFLPSNYPESIEFVITDVQHTLNSNKWVTKLNTIGMPLLVLEFADLRKELIDKQNQSIIDALNNRKLQFSSNMVQGSYNSSGTNTGVPLPIKSTSTDGRNATYLRETLSELGYTEKGVEIDNGGDITYETFAMADAVFRKIKELYPSYNLEVTGGNDYYHTTLSYISRHTRGRGIDFVLTPRGSQTTQQLDNVKGILEGFARGENAKFRFIDEYRHLTSAGTGDHFHISWGDGTEAGKYLKEALAKSGPNYYVNRISQNSPDQKKRYAQMDELRALNAEIVDVYGGKPFGIKTYNNFGQTTTQFVPKFPDDLVAAKNWLKNVKNSGLSIQQIQRQQYAINNPEAAAFIYGNGVNPNIVQ